MPVQKFRDTETGAGKTTSQRHVFHPLRGAVLHLPEDIQQAGGHPPQGPQEQVHESAQLKVPCSALSGTAWI